MRPARALALRTLAAARIRTLSFALLFAWVAVANTVGYRSTYPSVAERLRFAHAFGNNKAALLFYGAPHHLETVGGYASWRVAGFMSLFAAFFGALATIRAFRGEEETGRLELVAAGVITRSASFVARVAAIGVGIAVLWLATLVGLVAGGLPAPGAAYLALATVVPACVYAGVGALASQLMPTRRGALELAGAVLGLDFLLRVVSDTTSLSSLHWVIPLGWIEELRPFADPQPAALAPAAVVTVVLFGLALMLERRRDIGAAVFAPHDTTRPRFGLLGSPTGLALRSERVNLAVWVMATAAFAFVVGTVSKSVGSAGISSHLEEQLRKLGGVQIQTPSGYIGLTFLFFVLAVSLFCCAQLGAAREEEAEGRLELLLALPRSRTGWLAGRLALAVAGATLIAVGAGLGAALGATAVGADVSFLRLLEAGLNCLPAALLFLGIGALLVAAVPRVGVGAAYALVSVAFVWELFGAILKAPAWLLGASPFHQIGLVPAVPFRPVQALVMVAIGLLSAAAGLVGFRRRDLTGA